MKFIAVFFRRPKCAEAAYEGELRGLEPAATYDVDFRETFDIHETHRMAGGELARLRVELKTKPASLLVHYRKHRGK